MPGSFKCHSEYLMRINLYRRRVWTCKATGKGNLTFEEALVSEEKASKRIQNIPVQYIAPILREVQFSKSTTNLFSHLFYINNQMLINVRSQVLDAVLFSSYIVVNI